MRKYTVYVDGSYRDKNFINNKQVTHGGIVIWDNERNCAQASCHVYTDVPELVSMRNVGGELIAAYGAFYSIIVNLQKENRTHDDDLVEIQIVYDYEGIGKWLTGEWKAKQPGTIWYKAKCQELIDSVPNLCITYTWVRGHQTNEGNCLADKVAGYSLSEAEAYRIPCVKIGGN